MTERVWYVQLPGDGGSFVIHELDVDRLAADEAIDRMWAERSGE